MKSREKLTLMNPGPAISASAAAAARAPEAIDPLGDLTRVRTERLRQRQGTVDLHVGAIRRPHDRVGRRTAVDLGEHRLEQP